ncbi:uncharacterized protein LOC121816076 [Ovis aries]|uniref:uncharacterized protein LOC121816076 n=1 Tax=Ovis aries TaxID=9940 RepID=UPI001C2DFB9D|nr:uncharacterized protein LOC121816076 [Ovis aries]
MGRETGVDRCSLSVLRVKQFEIDSPEEIGSSHALKDRSQLLSDKRRGRTSNQEGRTIQAGIEQQKACGSSQGSWPGHRTAVRDRAARVWGCNSSRVNDPRPGTQVRKRSKKGGPEVRLSWIPPQGPYLARLRTSRGKGLELRSHLTLSKPGRCLLYFLVFVRSPAPLELVAAQRIRTRSGKMGRCHEGSSRQVLERKSHSSRL